jgi:uncharacterized protein YjaG (DUF416 family)
MEQSGALQYSESDMAARIAALSLPERALFACACAERLMPAHRWFCQITGSSNFTVVREALDAAWSADVGRAVNVADVIAVMPRDDEMGLFRAWAIARNAVASVAYALEVRLKGDVQASVWAARQLYEAADTVVQQAAPAYTYIENIDQEEPVQLIVRGINSALDDAGNPVHASLIAKARKDGEAFLGFVRINDH